MSESGDAAGGAGWLEEAADASAAWVRRTGLKDPLDASVSLCLRREGGAEEMAGLVGSCRRWLAVAGLASLLGGAAGVAAAIGLAPAGAEAALWVACVALGAGAVAAAGWALTRHRRAGGPVAERAKAAADLGGEAFEVTLEDPATFERAKLIGDDFGHAAVVPAAGLLVVEGVRFRHLVRAEDVAGCFGRGVGAFGEEDDPAAALFHARVVSYRVAGGPALAAVAVSCAARNEDLKEAIAAVLAPASAA